MSGYQRPRYATGRGRMTLARPTFAPIAATMDAAFSTIELADAQNLKLGQEAQVAALLLTDANGVTWRVRVNTDGSLATTRVPPRE